MGTTNTLDLNNRVTSVEEALDDMQAYETLTKADLIDESTKNAAITLTTFSIEKIKGLPIGRLIIDFRSTSDFGVTGANLGTLKSDVFTGTRPIANCVNNSDGVPGGVIFVNPPSMNPVKVYQITANKTYNADLFVMLKS